jgi:hypothetical protein
MRLWKTLAIVGIVFGISGVSWGYAQQRTGPGFFELRIYTTKPGKRDALAARFGNYTTKIYERYGITNVGYWYAASNASAIGVLDDRTFVYMRGYPSKQARDERLKAAQSDPEFVRIVLDQERNPEAALIETIHHIDLVPTDFSATRVTK